MNNRNWLVIGVVVLVALGVWFYFDSQKSVKLSEMEIKWFDELCKEYTECLKSNQGVVNEWLACMKKFPFSCASILDGLQECKTPVWVSPDGTEIEITFCTISIEW